MQSPLVPPSRFPAEDQSFVGYSRGEQLSRVETASFENERARNIPGHSAAIESEEVSDEQYQSSLQDLGSLVTTLPLIG